MVSFIAPTSHPLAQLTIELVPAHGRRRELERRRKGRVKNNLLQSEGHRCWLLGVVLVMDEGERELKLEVHACLCGFPGARARRLPRDRSALRLGRPPGAGAGVCFQRGEAGREERPLSHREREMKYQCFKDARRQREVHVI